MTDILWPKVLSLLVVPPGVVIVLGVFGLFQEHEAEIKPAFNACGIGGRCSPASRLRLSKIALAAQHDAPI